MADHTFGVDVLADTAYSPVLDRSVATIDVEQGVLEEHGAATEQEEPGKPGADAPGRAAAASGREAATAGPRDGPDFVEVLLEWAAVRHVVWWWCNGGCSLRLASLVCSVENLDSFGSSLLLGGMVCAHESGPALLIPHVSDLGGQTKPEPPHNWPFNPCRYVPDF